MDEIEEYYTVGTWKGMPRYMCRLCPFDTLRENVIKEHVLERHLRSVTAAPVKVPKVDRFGNPVEEGVNGED